MTGTQTPLKGERARESTVLPSPLGAASLGERGRDFLSLLYSLILSGETFHHAQPANGFLAQTPHGFLSAHFPFG
jgi:hypothetical protein